MMNKKKPNYRQIFIDIIESLGLSTDKTTRNLLENNDFSTEDVIKLNEMIFSKSTVNSNTRKHRSYDRSTIFNILQYQKSNNCTNSEVALHFGLSRNSVAKWKKLYQV